MNLRLLRSQFCFLMETGGVRRLWDHLKENVFFDLKHGVDTASWLPVEEFPKHIDNLKHGVRYRASYTSEVHRGLSIALKFLKQRGFDYKDVHFTDIGCGKGKVLIQVAKNFNFKRIIGLDYNQDFIEKASQNLKKINARRVELVRADATQYFHFGDINLIYIYNPFDAEILDKVIQNVTLSAQKTVLVYNKPLHKNLFEEKYKWQHIDTKKGWSPDWTTSIYAYGFADQNEIGNLQQAA